jgi:hypothetical protein
LVIGEDLSIEVAAKENDDWDYARTMQVLLKSPAGEWSSSVYSAGLELGSEFFLGPNRDCPHQGLLLSRGLDVFKVVDTFLFGDAGRKGVTIRLDPFQSVYRYDGLEASFRFDGSRFSIDFDRQGARVLPLLDMREMNSVSDPYGHICQLVNGWLQVSKGGLALSIGPFDGMEGAEIVTEWIYKRGSGFRIRDRDGYIRFTRETRRVFGPGVLTVRGKALNVSLEGMTARTPAIDHSWIDRVRVYEPNLRKPMLMRLNSLRTFGLELGGEWFPEAGCWWFRKPWVRDALEGVLSNFRIYTELFGWEERIRSLASMLLGALERGMTLPTILGCSDHSADAPPLLLSLCSKLDSATADVAIRAAASLIETMGKREIEPLGPPLITGGLVACTPFQSWTDSRVGEDGRPRRLPDGWEIGSNEWELPKYCLPEVNGLWIRCLRLLKGRGEGIGHPYPGVLEDSLAKMEAALRGRLWDGHCLASILDAKTGRSDQEVTSMGIVGLAGAHYLFTNQELQSALIHARKLIVNRRLRHLGNESMPFGMAITKPISPYLGDPEYHRSVVWPRDTPYLIEFMGRLGLGDTISELLMNTLDQTVSESALLYTSEIFGLPVGRNPNPSEGSMNPIPLKNPAQYWSHWCDPYVDRFFSIL